LRPSPTGFYAEITDGGIAKSSYKYSWTALEWDDSNESEKNEDWGTGEWDATANYAIEIYKSDQVPIDVGEIVWLESQNGPEPYYVFDLGSPVRMGKADGTIPARDEGDWKIALYNGAGSFYHRDELTCVNPFNQYIASGYPIQCAFMQGYWVVVSAGC